MGIKGKSFSVMVIEKVVVHAEEPCHDHSLPFTNLDLLVPPFDVGSFFCYKKPTTNLNFDAMLNTLKTSLSRTLSLFYPLAGEIVYNEAGENEIHCNNRGVDFIEAVADVELKELNLYNPDESIEGKLMPKRQRGVLAIQVTKLKCGGMVIGCMFDHRVVDGYSANMFFSSWVDMAQSKTPSIFPSFQRSVLNPRHPSFYTSSIGDVFTPYSPPSPSNQDFNNEDHVLSNRIYYIEGEQIKRLQLLASENGCRRSKLEAFTSFLWKIVASCMEDSGNHNQVCKMAIAVDGRKRLSEGDGEERDKLMASHFGNVLSMPYGEKKSWDLKEMSLSSLATEVHEFIKIATTKNHFLDLIDWVEEQRPQPLIARVFSGNELAIMVSAGQRFLIKDKMDFGWGKLAFESCHSPSTRKHCYVMTLPSPVHNEDWIVYMRLPMKHLNYIEAHASHMFKPLDGDYLQI